MAETSGQSVLGTGLQRVQYSFGLAVPKTELVEANMVPGGSAEIWKVIHEQAQLAYGNAQVPPTFSWKYKDGDGVDHNGIPFSQREGHAGHIIFAFSTYFPVEVVKWNEQTKQYVSIKEGVKCGDYVQVQVNVKAHSGNPSIKGSKGGLFLNPQAVLFLGYGQEIVSKPAAGSIFGFGAPKIPVGASATPVGPVNSPIAVAPAAPVAPTGISQTVETVGPAPVAAPQAPAPNFGVLPPHLQQQAQAPQAPQAPAFPSFPKV